MAKAAFVNVDKEEVIGALKQSSSEKFKKKFVHYIKTKVVKFQDVKRYFNTLFTQIRNFLSQFAYTRAAKDFLIWLVNTFIEGITANFATHFLFGVTFNIYFIFAHGVVINQTISIINRLKEKQNGEHSKIHKSDADIEESVTFIE